MSGLEGVSLAWEGILANKLRSFLTMLGIIIGVAAVIGLVSIGEGSARQATSQLEGLGSNLIVITPFRGAALKIADAQELVERVPALVAAAPVVQLATQEIRWGSASYEPASPTQGVTPEYAQVRNQGAAYGRFITAQDVAARARVAVIGQRVADGLFGRQNPLGQEIRLDGQPFTVVGVLEAKGSTFGADQDDMVAIPITVAQRLNGSTGVNVIYAQARGSAFAPLAVNHITAIFQLKTRRPGDPLPVRVTSQDQILDAINGVTQTFALLLAAVAGISLLVGGIGIMNIMLVSVTERTREIGIRKAIGATRRQILSQFLVESTVISMVGGLLGVALGAGGSLLLGPLLGFERLVSWPAVAGSFAFAAMIGLFFGVYPALKAANLDPIVALRYE